MDIVDGIWSSQVGVKLSLAPSTVLKTSQEPFSTTQAPMAARPAVAGEEVWTSRFWPYRVVLLDSPRDDA